jgi:ATP-NAD kinase C-terminal domain/Trypsin-like peptidase domain
MKSRDRWLIFILIGLSLTSCGQPNPSEIAETVKKSIVLISYQNEGGHGTGFIVEGKTGVCTVLTARHVVEGHRLNLQTNDQKLWKTDSIQASPNLDLAVVTFPYQGDGLIVATPTGSTCYTASANGPIIHPGMEAIAVTPICPLSLSSRPIVLPSGSVVSIWPLGDYELNTKLWTDGVLGTAILLGQRVDVPMADCEGKFIIWRENYSYYRTLREKLQWAGARIRYDNNHRN